MPTLLVRAECLDGEVTHRNNVRLMTRACMERKWGIPTGLITDGYSPYQIELMAMVFDKFLTDKPDDLQTVITTIDTRLQYICYPGTFQGRLCQVYWDGPELLLSPMPTH